LRKRCFGSRRCHRTWTSTAWSWCRCGNRSDRFRWIELG